MASLSKDKKKLSAEIVFVIGFATVILIGAILLSLPISGANHKSIGVFNAIFTSTSCVCVTGLVVLDTATAFSFFGKIVIICLIQVGGLGFMVFGTLIILALRKRISLKNRILIKDSFNVDGISGVIRLTKRVIQIALSIELLCALILSIRFIPKYGLLRGAGFSFFHAISAFCNAGFDLFGNFKSIVAFNKDPLVTLTIAFTIIIGGTGFIVINDLIEKKFCFKKLTLHTKIVLLIQSILLISGTVFFLITEYDNALLWSNKENFFIKLMNSFFQSTAVRTAGFSTLNQSNLTGVGKFVSIILMFIGASPTSTGGGIKTTTFFIVILQTINYIKNREENVIFGRSIPRIQAQKAFAVTIVSLSIVFLFTGLMMYFQRHVNVQFIDIAFEVVSALATVGNSSVGTNNLLRISQALIIFTMFLGRVGPITMLFALTPKTTVPQNKILYPDERIIIG